MPIGRVSTPPVATAAPGRARPANGRRGPRRHQTAEDAPPQQPVEAGERRDPSLSSSSPTWTRYASSGARRDDGGGRRAAGRGRSARRAVPELDRGTRRLRPACSAGPATPCRATASSSRPRVRVVHLVVAGGVVDERRLIGIDSDRRRAPACRSRTAGSRAGRAPFPRGASVALGVELAHQRGVVAKPQRRQHHRQDARVGQRQRRAERQRLHDGLSVSM